MKQPLNFPLTIGSRRARSASAQVGRSSCVKHSGGLTFLLNLIPFLMSFFVAVSHVELQLFLTGLTCKVQNLCARWEPNQHLCFPLCCCSIRRPTDAKCKEICKQIKMTNTFPCRNILCRYGAHICNRRPKLRSLIRNSSNYKSGVSSLVNICLGSRT